MNKKGCLLGALAGAAVLVVIAIIAFAVGSGTYNRLVKLDEAVNSSWAQVETVLQRRYDLIPNLVNTVKGYAKQEESVLTEVTRLRSQWGQAKTLEEKTDTATRMESALGRLMVVIEKYPDLKSNQNFLALQDELSGTENRIAVERRRYNETVQAYNTATRVFPANFIASFTGFKTRDAYFKTDPGAQAAPKVEF